MSEPTDPLQWRHLAEVLAAMPDTYGRLLGLHVDAGGGRCRACTVPGTGAPEADWPCAMRKLAALAREIHVRRIGGPQLKGARIG